MPNLRDQPCKKCGKKPRTKQSSYCNKCHVEIFKVRYAQEMNGERKLSDCPRCKKNGVIRPRSPGQSYCANCKRDVDMEYARRRNNSKPENFRGHHAPSRPVREGLIYCRGCGRALAPKMFYHDASSKNGLTSRCKMCQSDRERIRRNRDKHAFRAKQKRYYEANKERVLARCRIYQIQRKRAAFQKALEEKSK